SCGGKTHQRQTRRNGKGEDFRDPKSRHQTSRTQRVPAGLSESLGRGCQQRGDEKRNTCRRERA
ncbi:MAG: hypothetical protein ACK55I_20030, partial [bacterium]